MITVLCHGCFDVLHIGHLRLFKKARYMGDRLVVSLLSDEFVRASKGSKRPFHNLAIRREMVEALSAVSETVVVDGPGHEAVERMIATVKPQIYVKGSEYRGRIPEQAFAESIGVKIAFIDMEQYEDAVISTSRILISGEQNVARSV